MNTKQAQDVLIQVAKLAQKGGILSLEDASTVLLAIRILEGRENTVEVGERAVKAEETPITKQESEKIEA